MQSPRVSGSEGLGVLGVQGLGFGFKGLGYLGLEAPPPPRVVFGGFYGFRGLGL